MAASTLAMTTGASTAAADAVTVTFVNRNSGKCLEVENSSRANGARVQQWSCNGQAGSQWYTKPAGGRYKYIVNRNSGKCLEIENSSRSNGARAQQWDCNGQAGAKWIIGDYIGTWDARKIYNSSGKYLEIENSSQSNGARAQQWADGMQAGMMWNFRN